MSYTLHDLLSHPDLGLVLLNPDIDPTEVVLSWITISELPDPAPWLDGGEFLLVTGLTVPEHRRGQEEYVRRLVDAGVATLGFASRMSFDSPPEGLRTACFSHHLPLVDIPYRTPFVAITQVGCRGILDSHYRRIDADLQVHEQMGDQLLGGSGLGAMIESLRRVVDAPVTLVDSYGNVLASAPPGHSTRPLRFALDDVSQGTPESPVHDGERFIWPILMNQSVQAFLLIEGRDDFEGSRTLRYAATLLGIELSRRHAVLAGRRELLGQVLQDVLHRQRDDEGCRKLLERHGISATVRYRAVFVDRQSVRNAELLGLAVAAEATAHEGGLIPSAALDEGPVLLVDDDRDPLAIAGSLRSRLRHGGEAAPAVGLGGYGRDVHGLRISLFEAINGATTREQDGSADEVRRLSPLLAASSGADWADLAEEVIRPLQEHGRQAALLETLRAYLEHNGSVADTAAALHVHRHTLRYRLTRIHQLCGLDPQNLTDLVEYRMALLILDAS